MIDQWQGLRARAEALAHELASPTLDNMRRPRIQKELSYLTGVLERHDRVATLDREIAASRDQAEKTTDKELAALFTEEISSLQAQRSEAQAALDDFMYPPDPMDDRSIFLEIRAGTGGQEASLFAADLLKMYTNYATKNRWKVSIDSVSTTDLKGFREVVAHIQGKGVYGHLKYESGVHRVQRVPVTEGSGRIHTSTATVAVLPEAEEVDVTISPADLRIDVYRSGGAGGQHVNTTDSAVRITHIPSGVVVTCQDERSQHKNKAKAMKILQSRLLAAQLEKQAEAMSQQRKAMVGMAKRSEKLRTYNFPQNRVTDHEIELTLNKLDMVIEGELDEIVHGHRAREREIRVNQPFAFTE